jgi:hypothetical protein
VVASIHLEAVVASIHLEVMTVATSEAAQLRETLPTSSRVVGPYENPVTWKFDSLMSKNLNSELKKEESYTYDHRVRWDTDRMGRGMQTAQIMLIIYY